MKLFRNKKTGGSRSHAFVQFDSADVASVASQAMSGYFMGDRQLVCHVVEKGKLHEGMFLPPKGSKVKVEGVPPVEALIVEEVEVKEKEMTERRARQIKRAHGQKLKKLKGLGIDFDGN